MLINVLFIRARIRAVRTDELTTVDRTQTVIKGKQAQDSICCPGFCGREMGGRKIARA